VSDQTTLAPCPFCGAAAHFDHDDNGWNWIECADCGASTNARVSAMDDCKPLLAEQWNRRASANPDVSAYIASLVAERDALAEDAERYRWLRKRGSQQDFASALWEDDMDAAIDAARLSAKEPT
jgi:Lar family restriction alleviation protein